MSFTLDTRVCGIPAKVRVTHLHHQPGNAWADNPDDYHGYTEVEFDILDRRGRPAPWLERKLTPKEIGRIEQEIINQQEY